jgi:4-hydroxy-tetrahydrodipicolinate synthase
VNPIGGVTVAAITPHGQQGHELDIGAELELIDFVTQSRVQGIALMGATGEFLTVSFDERVRLTYLVVKRSRVPVLVGVGHAALDGALELGREACSAGAAGLLLMPPCFFRYSQADIKEFYQQYAAQIGVSVPVYLYNIPSFCTPIECDTALELLATGLFAGIKDSSGSFDYFTRLKELRDRHRFTLLIGNDVIFTRARAAGADGVVSGVACAVPELVLALDQAILAGHTAEIDRLEGRLQEFISWIDRFPTPVIIKVALALRGVKAGPLAVPLPPESQREMDKFREWYRGWLPEVRKESARA